MAVKKYRAKKIISKLLFGILVLVIVIPILFPLYFVLISSFKNMAQVYIMPPKLFGFKPILDNYIYIFKTQHYGTYMMNSTIVAVASTALSLLLGVPAAYAIARYKMGKANTAILTARLLPNISILLPYYFIFSKLRMIDTYGVLILSHMVLSLPLIVWIMVGFFSDLPLELEEAAIVDGCTRQKYFQFALMLSGEKTRTLPLSLQNFVSGADIRWGRMLAATIVVIVPTIILTMLLQKYIVQGMTAGAVKG